MRSHAALDIAGRIPKFLKIKDLIGKFHSFDSMSVLEVGAGSGVISSYLANLVGDNGRVVAVDVVDERIASDGYVFELVKDAKLPFPSDSFDIIISNHVIEHVGTSDDQMTHLSEIARVLRKDGIVYLAVPNKYTFIEPHYKLPLLSWLPVNIASSFVRITGRGDQYDCNPPPKWLLYNFFARTGLYADNITYDAIKIIKRLEPGGSLMKLVYSLPISFLKPFDLFIPTRTFILSKLKPQ